MLPLPKPTTWKVNVASKPEPLKLSVVSSTSEKPPGVSPAVLSIVVCGDASESPVCVKKVPFCTFVQ
jgi:hypothetical protein